MTTTARSLTVRLAASTNVDLIEALLFADYATCELCDTPAAYLYTRLDEDGAEIHVCEHCADTVDLGAFDCD